MPGFILHIGASMICPHGGQISAISSNTQVTVGGGQIAATAADNFIVTGCIFNISSVPHPCITAKWLVNATRVLINGQPAVLNDAIGICQSADQSPQGPPNIVAFQIRVRGT